MRAPNLILLLLAVSAFAHAPEPKIVSHNTSSLWDAINPNGHAAQTVDALFDAPLHPIQTFLNVAHGIENTFVNFGAGLGSGNYEKAGEAGFGIALMLLPEARLGKLGEVAEAGNVARAAEGTAVRFSRAGGATGDFLIPGEDALQAGLRDPVLYGTRLTTTPTFNPALAENGLTTGRALNASVEIGPSAFSDRGNLIQTIIHEETHIRLDLRTAQGSQRAIGIQSTLSSEEAYAEAVAQRFWQRFGGR